MKSLMATGPHLSATAYKPYKTILSNGMDTEHRRQIHRLLVRLHPGPSTRTHHPPFYRLGATKGDEVQRKIMIPAEILTEHLGSSHLAIPCPRVYRPPIRDTHPSQG